MRLLIFGASGGVGQWAVKLAHQKGWDVTAVVRPSSNYSAPEGVRLVLGEAIESSFIKSIVGDFNTVISCIGIRRAGLNPWSKILSPPNLVATVTANIISAAEGNEQFRCMWISAAGVGKTKKYCSPVIRKLVTLGNIGVAYTDLERAEQQMQASEFNAVAVRPVTLSPGNPTGKASTTDSYHLLSTVRRSDVALWMIRNIELNQQPIFIS